MGYKGKEYLPLKFSGHRLICYVILFSYLIVSIFPIYWMTITSFKSRVETYRTPPTYIPTNPTFENYQIIFTTRPFARYMYNSIVIALVATLICILVGSIAAYGFNRFRFRGNRFWLFIILASRILPPIALITPFFIMAGKLGLVDTLRAQIMVEVYQWLPFTIWIMESFFDAIPRELDESAQIDGCTRSQSFRKVILPLSVPAMSSTAIIAFVGSWNEFLYNLILAPTPAAKNLSVGASDFIADMFISWNQMGAGGLITCIPALIFVLFFQKYIVQGLVAGSVKG